jgi:hypothetical protein
MRSGRAIWLALGGVWLLGFAAIALSNAGRKPMSHGSSVSSNFALSSPGVVATDDTEVPSVREIYGFFPGGLTGLRTMEYVAYGHKTRRMEAMHSVEWQTSVPGGARLFSVTAGVSPAKVREFWVGWISDGHAHLRSLSKLLTLTAPLAQGETAIFPAVMDGVGAASLYTWRVTDKGATLWQRVFSATAGPTPARLLAEIQGRPIVSGAAAVPGLRSHHAVVGWLARTEDVASVFGMAILENEGVTIRQSRPIQWSAPVERQRIGVWAPALDRFELAAVVVGDGVPATYKLAKFGMSPDGPDGALSDEPLDLIPGQLAAAAVDYSSSRDEPRCRPVFLTTGGHLLDQFGQVIRESVALDTALPIAITREGRFWGKLMPDGSLAFEPL